MRSHVERAGDGSPEADRRRSEPRARSDRPPRSTPACLGNTPRPLRLAHQLGVLCFGEVLQYRAVHRQFHPSLPMGMTVVKGSCRRIRHAASVMGPGIRHVTGRVPRSNGVTARRSVCRGRGGRSRRAKRCACMNIRYRARGARRRTLAAGGLRRSYSAGVIGIRPVDSPADGDIAARQLPAEKVCGAGWERVGHATADRSIGSFVAMARRGTAASSVVLMTRIRCARSPRQRTRSQQALNSRRA